MTTPRDPLNVLIGTGTLYYAKITGSEPAAPDNPGTAPAVGWLDFGYTEDGVNVSLDRSVADVEVAEEIDPVYVLQTARSFGVSAASAEATLDTLALSMGGAVTVGEDRAGAEVNHDKWSPATGTASFDEYELLLRAPAPGSDKLRDWFFPRAMVVGAVSIPHAKAPAKSVVAIEFRVVKPTAGEIVEIVDQK